MMRAIWSLLKFAIFVTLLYLGLFLVAPFIMILLLMFGVIK